MMSSLLLASVALAAGTGNASGTFACDLQVPDHGRFELQGDFNEAGLASNMAELDDVAEDFAVARWEGGESVIITDGTTGWLWTSPRIDRQRFQVSVTEYGSAMAFMMIESLNFVGRHDVRRLIAFGLCDLESHIPEASQ